MRSTFMSSKSVGGALRQGSWQLYSLRGGLASPGLQHPRRRQRLARRQRRSPEPDASIVQNHAPFSGMEPPMYYDVL
jgi:hypothetical protein